MDSDAFGTEEKSPNAPDQTSHLNISLPIRDSVSEYTVGDTPTFQANNPVSQDIQNIGCNIKPENPFSVPEENTQNRASGHDEAEPASSPASIRDMPGKEQTDSKGNSTLQTEEVTGNFDLHETIASAAEENTLSGREVTRAIAADNRSHSESPVKGEKMHTFQADAIQTTALTSPDSSHRIEASVLKRSLVPSISSLDATEISTQGVAGTIVSHKAGADGCLQHLAKSRMDNASDQAIDSQTPSDMELASVTPLVGNKVLASANSLNREPSKPTSPEQTVSGPARPSVSTEALRSVPATLFQIDSIPKVDDTFRSSPSLRSPEKKYEEPKVQIGQIDVIIEAAAQPTAKSTTASSTIDLASRNYLRRL
jgi:hypothetical protein